MNMNSQATRCEKPARLSMFLAGKRKVFPCPLPSRCAFICLNAFFCRDPSWECCFLRFHLEAGSIVYVSGMQGMDMKKMKHLSIFRDLFISCVMWSSCFAEARGRWCQGRNKTDSSEPGHGSAGEILPLRMILPVVDKPSKSIKN